MLASSPSELPRTITSYTHLIPSVDERLQLYKALIIVLGRPSRLEPLQHTLSLS